MFSNRGSTIVEIMIALGLVGLVSLGIFSLSQETLKTIQSNQLAATRDQLATQFRQSAGRILNLKLSLKKSENQDFINCVCGTASGCTSGKSYPLALYDNSVPDEPIKKFYDYSGIPCLETASNCVIEVKVNFVAQCKPTLPSADPTAPASCVGVPVEFFAVNFTIQPKGKTPEQGSLFKSISGSTYTQVSNLVPSGSGVCP